MSEGAYPSWVEEATEGARRVKSIGLDALLAKEASTSGAMGHKGHTFPIWLDVPFASLAPSPISLSPDKKAVSLWLSSHKPVALTKGMRVKVKAPSNAFPVLSPIAHKAQERAGGEARQAGYVKSLSSAHGAPGGPRRTWQDKLKGM